MTKKKTALHPSELTRKQLSKREHEALQRRRLLVGAGLVFGLVVIVLAWGLISEFVLKPAQPVAIVGGEEIRTDTYQKMVQYQRWNYRNYLDRLQSQRLDLATQEGQEFLVQYLDSQIQQIQQEIGTLPTSVFDQLIDDKLVRQEATMRGVTVTNEEVQLKFEGYFGYDRNPPTPEPTITVTEPITITPMPTATLMTLDEYTDLADSWLDSAKKAADFDRSDLEHLLESSIYQEKFEALLAAEVPTTADQVHARHILVETREEAESVLARLEAGEDFATIAAEVSLDTSNKDNGGDLGWFSRGQMVPEFEEPVFAMEPGQLSDIIETEFGFHIVLLEEADPNHELDDAALDQAQQAYISAWYTTARMSDDVIRKWNSTMIPEDR